MLGVGLALLASTDDSLASLAALLPSSEAT
jgi:hypothetical protein